MTRSSHLSRHTLPGVVVPAPIDYGIRGLISLALSTDERTKVEVIAGDHGLSCKFLAQILVTLRDAGIVNTHRGSEGGYQLARRPDEIRVFEVFNALSPAVAPSGSANGSRAAAAANDAWRQIQSTVIAALGTLTVADLAGLTHPVPTVDR